MLPETTCAPAQQLISKVRVAVTALSQDGVQIVMRVSGQEWQVGDDAKSVIGRLDAELTQSVVPLSRVS